MIEENLNPPEINDDNNIVEVEQVDEIPEIDDGTLDGAVEDIGQLCSDQTCVQGLVEVVDTAMNSEEGLDETSINLIKSSVENIYNRHGIPRRYRTKLPALESFNKGDKYTFTKDLKVSLEGVFGDIWKGIKAAWNAICDFFYGIWKAIFGTKKEKVESNLKETKTNLGLLYKQNPSVEVSITKAKFIEILKFLRASGIFGSISAKEIEYLFQSTDDASKFLIDCTKNASSKLKDDCDYFKANLNLINVLKKEWEKNWTDKTSVVGYDESKEKVYNSNSVKSAISDIYKSLNKEFTKEKISENDLFLFMKGDHDEGGISKEKEEKIREILGSKFSDEAYDVIIERLEKMSDNEIVATFKIGTLENYISVLEGAMDCFNQADKIANGEGKATLNKVSKNPIPDKGLVNVTKDSLGGITKNSKATLTHADMLTNLLNKKMKEALSPENAKKRADDVQRQLKDPNVDTIEI